MKHTSTFLLLKAAALLAGLPARAQAPGPEARLPAAAKALQRAYTASAAT